MMLGFPKEPRSSGSGRPRCARCGSAVDLHYVGPARYLCESCLRRPLNAPAVPFDVVVDGWTDHLGALQAAGELIAVRLPHGFYGVCLLAGESAFDLAYRSLRRKRPLLRAPRRLTTTPA